MNEDRPYVIERIEKNASPEVARHNRSNGMIGVGIVLLLFAVASTVSTEGAPVTGAVVIALLGIALLVGGLAIRR